MEKSILKKFATESRKLLMANVENQLNKYRVEEQFEKTISGDLIILKNDKYTLSPMTQEEYNCRERLVKRIKDLSDNNDIKTGIKRVIEESAYTWFNRIIAIRYMEVNDMLPLTKDNQSLNIRVLSSKDSIHPEILKMINLTNSLLDLNIDFNVYSKLTTENEQFNYVLKKVCNKLGKIIPQIFDGYTEYINLLLPDNLLLNNGFVNKLITELGEDSYESVEVIGWLYQYYNQDEKDRVINAKKTYKKDEIAYATQLFTPDWIVKYMVENSLGRYVLEHGYSESLKNNWKYYVDSELEQKEKVKPIEIKFIDPCCGSGHILVYAFEVLVQIYKDYGYNVSDIPELILKNNIYGLDIDDRAGQLSILSVMLKAREYDNEIFNKVKELNVMAMQESNGIDLSMFPEDLITQSDISYLINTFKNAKEIGSLLNVEPHDYSMTLSKLQNNIFDLILSEQLRPLIKQSEILSQKYDVVVTNPPYLSSSLMDKNIKEYICKYYEYGKNDLYSSFIIKCINMINENGLFGFLSPYIWMYTKSFVDFRKFILNSINIKTLVQLEYNAFEGACVPVATGILAKTKISNGVYFDLSNFKGCDNQAPKVLEALNNDVGYRYIYNLDLSRKTEDKAILFRASDKIVDLIINCNKLGEDERPKAGLQTGDTNRFLRYWYEVAYDKIYFNFDGSANTIYANKKWYPIAKGGDYRKWYGNLLEIVNWENDGYEIKNFFSDDGKLKSRPQNTYTYFKSAVSCSALTSAIVTYRYYPIGCIYDVNLRSIFADEEKKYYLLGLLNTKIMEKIGKILSPTMALNVNDIERFPIIYNNEVYISNLVKENINLCKEDWDSLETSWNFKKNFLIGAGSNLNKVVNEGLLKIKSNFNKLKLQEEKLNKCFNEIYDLSDEIDYKVDDCNVSINIPTNINIVKSLISYFVGCLFGRYSLDEEGLIFAGGEFDTNRYSKFKPDVDNIIPITDTKYFKDDIVSKFKEFLCIAFSEETLNENMDYIAEVLGKKSGETSEDTIRRYFVNDFFKDHIQTYQKKPIYWLLDSGKKNGFKALFYLHRYDKDLISRVRLDYIGKIQTIYENRLKEIETDLNSSLELSTYEVKQLEKEQNNLYEKLEEVKKYYVKLSTIGDKNIELDLDNGVTENYKLFSYVDPETNEESSILGEAKIIAPKKK